MGLSSSTSRRTGARPAGGLRPSSSSSFLSWSRSIPRPPSPSSRAIKIARPGRPIFNPWARTGSVCRTTRETITTSGRSFVMENQIDDFPRSWAPKPYADLCKTAECKGSSINDEKALCVFVHQTEDKNVDGLKALATKNEKADTLFFYATEDAGIAEQVVRLCDIKPPKGEATLVLLDLDDDGAYYLTNTSD